MEQSTKEEGTTLFTSTDRVRGKQQEGSDLDVFVLRKQGTER